jgi:hypothetical protein
MGFINKYVSLLVLKKIDSNENINLKCESCDKLHLIERNWTRGG